MPGSVQETILNTKAMNRQIKFRGKRTDNGAWVEGFLDFNPIQSEWIIHVIEDLPPTQSDPGGDIYSERFEVDPATVGQFTGLYDATKWESLTDAEKQTWLNGYDESGKRNTAETWRGREIWEGDIVRNSNRSIITLPTDDKLYVVEWVEGRYGEIDDGPTWLMDKPGFVFRKIHKGMSLIFSQSQIEVIGNIFDNPELLNP